MPFSWHAGVYVSNRKRLSLFDACQDYWHERSALSSKTWVVEALLITENWSLFDTSDAFRINNLRDLIRLIFLIPGGLKVLYVLLSTCYPCLFLQVFSNSTGIIIMCYDSADILTRSRRANDSTLDTLVRILNLEKLFHSARYHEEQTVFLWFLANFSPIQSI